jgi:predicted dehydrogenase
MPERIRYACIGFGGIAENRIAREGFALDRNRFDPLAEAELVGAFDLAPARRGVAETLGLKWYGSVDEILADRSIDAVFIATNNRSHAQIGLAALEAGKHCLIEKPMATTIEDAETMRSLASSRSLVLMADHMMTRNEFNHKARELIRFRRIGTINDIHLHMQFLYGATPEEAATWRCSEPEELGGPIGDVGSHCLYMAEFLADSRIVSIQCSYAPKKLDIVVEDGAFIRFTMKNGIVGSAAASFAEPRGGLAGTLRNLGYEIYGTAGICRGFATLFQLSGHPDEPVGIELEIDDGKNREPVSVAERPNIYRETILDHVRAIRNGATDTANEAVHNLELVLAAHRSAKENGVRITI